MRSYTGRITDQMMNVVDPSAIAASDPYPASTYRQLVEQVARLAYLNMDQMLFFRGQDRDYRNKAGSSTFYPTIYRGDYLPQQEVRYRFAMLDEAARQLASLFRSAQVEGHRELARKRYVQWSILQHYGVSVTPLLDFTHSLRVACSFAQHDNDGTKGYVFVFGLPYVTNRISINSEHDLVNVRLLSICPPDALRPYFQEGYLAGTTDITSDYESKTELDFTNRLVAKFVIPKDGSFWGRGFSAIPRSVLYPPNDRVGKMCESLTIRLSEEVLPGDLGAFLREWTGLEAQLLSQARRLKDRVPSIRTAISILWEAGVIDESTAQTLNQLRKFRNLVVHEPDRVKPSDLLQQSEEIRSIRNLLE